MPNYYSRQSICKCLKRNLNRVFKGQFKAVPGVKSYPLCVVATVREPCIEAGLVKVLVPHLNSNNQEMLLNTGRAIGRICFDNCELV